MEGLVLGRVADTWGQGGWACNGTCLEMVWEWKRGRKSREDDVDSIARMFQELELVLENPLPGSFIYSCVYCNYFLIGSVTDDAQRPGRDGSKRLCVLEGNFPRWPAFCCCVLTSEVFCIPLYLPHTQLQN